MAEDAGSLPLILVADDVEANVELLVDQLETLGFRTIVARDAPSALAECLDRRPDLAILDISMPAGDLGIPDRDAGFEVCRRLKRDARTARIPVIFVTAYPERLLTGERPEPTYLVTKPFEPDTLKATIFQALSLATPTASEARAT